MIGDVVVGAFFAEQKDKARRRSGGEGWMS
jgi:hypothetical protein